MTRYVYLGPEGTFAEQALRTLLSSPLGAPARGPGQGARRARLDPVPSVPDA